ncbi:LysR family transcriptional regulator [Trinickia terrae]|uniref:LysR family transcriptional regulator n=1 Tax=Trinickia terrae TaxID=2571161 RepID=A0A4U1I668_9BURK|nr:LysR family transcriptional regulator [Trinickia terrae]
MLDARKIDLNLAVVFLALWEERSVTRAAARLALSQAAASAALARLRETCEDELFLRAKGGMQPTQRALEIVAQLENGIGSLAAALAPAPRFDPPTSTRRFVIGMSDDFEMAIGPEISRRVLERASGVSVIFRQTNRHTVDAMLEEQQIELAVTVGAAPKRWASCEALGKSNYACLADSARWGIALPLTLDEYLALPHLLVSFSGREGAVDTALRAIGKVRHVQTALTHFSAVPAFLTSVKAVTTIPLHAARVLARVSQLGICAPPVHFDDYEVSMVYRRTSAHDPGLEWFKGIVHEAFQALDLRPVRPVRPIRTARRSAAKSKKSPT